MGRPLNPPRLSGGVTKNRSATLQSLSTSLHQAARTLQTASTSPSPPLSLLNAAYRPILRAALTLHTDFNASASRPATPQTPPLTTTPPADTPDNAHITPRNRYRYEPLPRPTRRQSHPTTPRLRHINHRLVADMEHTASLSLFHPTNSADETVRRESIVNRRRLRRNRELQERWLSRINTHAEALALRRLAREELPTDTTALFPLHERTFSAERVLNHPQRDRDSVREAVQEALQETVRAREE